MSTPQRPRILPPYTRLKSRFDREPPGYYIVHKDKNGEIRVRPKRVFTVWRFLTTNRFLAFLLSAAQAGIASVTLFFITASIYASLRWIRAKFGAESVAPYLEHGLATIGDWGSLAAFGWFTISGLITDIRNWAWEMRSPPARLIPEKEA